MKSATSTLNPFAESYVPVSRRGGPNGKNDTKYVGTESKGAIEGSVTAPQQWDSTSLVPQLYTSQGWHTAEDSGLKGNLGYGFHGSPSFNSSEITEKADQDDDFEMDMAYLQMTFPGIEEESLSQVYLANKGDLDSAIDMLNHLELSVDFSQKLPETLDIGDVPDHAGSAPETGGEKLKDVNVESGASSSVLSNANAGV